MMADFKEVNLTCEDEEQYSKQIIPSTACNGIEYSHQKSLYAHGESVYRPDERTCSQDESLYTQNEVVQVKEETENVDKSWKYRTIKSFFLFNAWVGMGLWASLPSPCIDALKAIVDCNYEQISRPLAVKMAGIMFGSVTFGLLTDKFKKKTDLILCLILLLAGLSITAVPWLPNLIAMSGAFFMNGMAHGGLSAVGNVHAISLWGKNAASPLLCIHMGYSLGTILGPVLVAPFLSTSHPNATDTPANETLLFKSAAIDGQTLPFNVHSKSVYMSFFQSDDIWDTELNSTPSNSTIPDIRAPFGAAGGFTVVISAIFLIYAYIPYHNTHESNHIRQQTLQRKQSMAEIVSPASCAGGNTGYGIEMFSMIFLLNVFFSAKDTCVTSFLQPLAVHTPTLDFTMKQADLLITVHYTCFGIGRIVVAIIAKWVSIKVLICLELLCLIGVQTALALFGLNSNLNFWLTTCSFALVSGPVLPSGFSWVDRYIKMTAFGYAITNVGIGIGGFLFQWLCGYIYNYKKHDYLLYLSLICGVCEFVVYLVIQYSGFKKGDRYLKKVAPLPSVTVQSATNLPNEHQTQNGYVPQNGETFQNGHITHIGQTYGNGNVQHNMQVQFEEEDSANISDLQPLLEEQE